MAVLYNRNTPIRRNEVNMTIEEFIEKETSIWGVDYIFDLYDRGYVPTFVEGLGWRFMPTKVVDRNRFSYVGMRVASVS